MKMIIAVMALCFTFTAIAEEPIKPPVDSQALLTFLEQAKDLAVQTIDGVKKTDLIHGYLTPYYASRKNSQPSGSLVSFTVRETHRKEKLGEMEDRIIVIFHDEKEPEVKRIQIWLNQGIVGATR